MAEEIAEAVAILYQKSLDRSVLPVDWISAIVAAIFKKGKKSLPENYRPVSLTCILCKCLELEVIIREHIVEHMYRNCLFSNYQYGFLKGRSTTLQLLFAFEEWMEALDNGYEIDCVYTDFSKAFDTVPHQRLLGKLQAYGIPGIRTDCQMDRSISYEQKTESGSKRPIFRMGQHTIRCATGLRSGACTICYIH